MYVKKPAKCKYKIFILLFGILFLFQNPAHAKAARLADLTVTNTRDDLLLYLKVEGAFSEKMKNAILSGVNTTFSFFISLRLVRNLWPDKKIAEIKVTNTIKYDNLKKKFFITKSWKDDEILVTQSLIEAEKLMTSIDSLKIVPLSRLEKGRQYQIKAKAELGKTTLPFYLHYVFFFVSLWDFKTDWHTISFIY